VHACCARAMRSGAHASGRGAREQGGCCRLAGLAPSAAVPVHVSDAGGVAAAVAIAPAIAPSAPSAPAVRVRSLPGDDEPPGRSAVAAIRGRAPPSSR